MKTMCLLPALLFYLPCKTQMLHQPVAALYVSANAYSIRHVDVFACTGNPAALAQLSNASIGVYGEKRFLLSAFNDCRLITAFSTSSGNVGINASYYGFSDYHESGIGLIYARKLGKSAAAGLQFNYHSIGIAGLGKASAIGVHIGSVFNLSNDLHAGIRISNPAGGKFGQLMQEKLPFVYATGIGFDASEKIFISLEVIKEEDQPVSINAGMQYSIARQLLLRTAIASATGSFCVGAGFLWNDLRADIVSGFHPRLGITPGFLCAFNFKKKKVNEN